VVVQVRTGVSEQMVVQNPGAAVLTVLDPHGKPFLRVSKAGVRGNVADPFFSETLNPPEVPARLPAEARRGAKAHWVRLSKTDSFGWFDPRLVPATSAAAPADGVVSRWTVGMRLGSTPVAVAGTIERHAVTGSFVASVDPAPGVVVTVTQGRVPALLLVAAPRQQVVVVGSDGRDFLRLDPKGAWANTTSRSFRDNVDFTDRAGGRTGWVKVGEPGRISWLDTRLQYAADRPPAVVERQGRTAELGRWSIPVRIDGAPAHLTGSITWLPITALPAKDRGGFPVAAAGTASAAVLGVAALALLARRRRSAAPA
jgi:hypothetical protein